MYMYATACMCVFVCCTLKGLVQTKIWTQMGFETQALLIINHMLYHYSMYIYIYHYNIIIILLYL